MRRKIERTIELSPAEVKEAIVLFLKQKDAPVPADPNTLSFQQFDVFDGVSVNWIEEHEFA